MKTLLAGLTLAGGLGFAALPGTAAPFTPATPDATTSGVELAAYGEGRCRRLRRACVNKDARGERGMGNCARYRRACSRWWRD